MRLNWLTTFEIIDNRTMQEMHYEPKQNFIKSGRVIKRCERCKRWVLEIDYNDFCSEGICEMSQEISLEDIKGRESNTN